MVITARRLMTKSTLTPHSADAFPQPMAGSSSDAAMPAAPVSPAHSDDEDYLGLALPMGLDSASDVEEDM